jgi:hypothetical protein
MRCPLKDNDVLSRVDPGRDLKKDLQFPFFAAFSETGVFEGEPLGPTLLSMADCVKNSVENLALLL